MHSCLPMQIRNRNLHVVSLLRHRPVLVHVIQIDERVNAIKMKSKEIHMK
jgi:hypothetical protein